MAGCINGGFRTGYAAFCVTLHVKKGADELVGKTDELAPQALHVAEKQRTSAKEAPSVNSL